jgi:hypothetical protein
MNLREKPCVMPFLDNHKCDWGQISLLQRGASLETERIKPSTSLDNQTNISKL